MFVHELDDYELEHRVFRLADTLPVGAPLRLATLVTCRRPAAQTTGELRAVLLRGDQRRPICATTIQLPISEPDID